MKSINQSVIPYNVEHVYENTETSFVEIMSQSSNRAEGTRWPSTKGIFRYSFDSEAAINGTSKRSIASQTDDSLFPTVSTRLYSKKNKSTSWISNPRLLATGSLMMGVAGVSTKQAILCTKIAANILFRQNYILPPSLEKEYRKKMKLRRKLAKMTPSVSQESTAEQTVQTRQEVADIVTTHADLETDQEQLPVDSNCLSENEKNDDLIEVEERGLSEQGRKEVLSRMLCTPTALRAAHHLISTLGHRTSRRVGENGRSNCQSW